ncbi:hypothetical protein [Rhizobium leguminosarum]|uniref:hypothetical protein n=1 Tax=Rhizobium leguminosarum TaxID=384 RepID=UPI0021BC19C5|nr:hypothetical protein [Rhizobium leguminosarum]
MVDLFDNESQAINLFLDVLREKAQTGLQAKRTCGHPAGLILVPVVADDNPVIS